MRSIIKVSTVGNEDTKRSVHIFPRMVTQWDTEREAVILIHLLSTHICCQIFTLSFWTELVQGTSKSF